jgi:hypothetical protein
MGQRVNQTAPTKGLIGNRSPNRPPNTQKPGGGRRVVRVLRALDPLTYVTQQRGNIPATVESLDKPAISKNVVTQAGRRLLGGRRQNVRRLFRRDPYNIWSATAPPPFGTNATQATFSPEAEHVDTVNPNPSFHPEQLPGAVKIVRQPQAAAGTKNRGKVMKPNLQTLTGGKTLRRR